MSKQASCADRTIVVPTCGGFRRDEYAIPGPFPVLGDVEANNRRIGHHWFDADSVRFFRGKTHGGTILGRFFVASRQFVGSDGIASPREYAVHIASDRGEVDTVSFRKANGGWREQYPSAKFARAALGQFLASDGAE